MNTSAMFKSLVICLTLSMVGAAVAQTNVAPANSSAGMIEVINPATGQKYLLLPNGTWTMSQELPVKPTVSSSTVIVAPVPPSVAQPKPVITDQPSRAARGPQPQGGLFGLGREILPGDPEYNRGSLNPKNR